MTRLQSWEVTHICPGPDFPTPLVHGRRAALLLPQALRYGSLSPQFADMSCRQRYRYHSSRAVDEMECHIQRAPEHPLHLLDACGGALMWATFSSPRGCTCDRTARKSCYRYLRVSI